MNNSLKVENICFNYKQNNILNNISFEYNSTGVIALLGPNGAGKTTLMNILVGLLSPKSGVAQLNNVDILKNNKYSIENIGYLPQNFDIYDNVTGLDFLSYVCDCKNISKNDKNKEIDKVVDKFNLSSVINSSFKKYSGGYKRRLGIAQAMIGNPKLVVVDEPTVGLDPEQRFEFRQYLSNISDETIILISTHIVEDIEYYCRKILMLNNKEIGFDGTPEEFTESVNNKIYKGVVTSDELNLLKHKVKILQNSRVSNNEISIRAICEDYIPDNLSKDSCSLEDAYVYNRNK